MSLTISPSPFGSLVVSVAETGSTLSVTTVATSPCVLSMALGVPGPAGATGSQGPAGTNGSNGVGVPVGGTAGQVLSKINSTNYNTQWTTPSGGTWGSITGTLSSQTDLQNALNAKLSTSAAASTYLPLAGGTMSGTIFLPSLRNLLNTDLTVTAYNDTGAGTNFVHTFNAYDGTFALATNGGGLKFPDETVQVTAGLPLTGGTMTGGLVILDASVPASVTINAEDGTYAVGPNGSTLLTQNGLEITGAGNGIIFPDSTQQLTAWLGYNGTTSQYIRGDGSLYTFPPVGDRYLTSSTTTLTVDSGNGKTMTVGTGLSYSPQQDITVSYNNANHMHGTVLTYNSATGVMTWDSNTHSGSGTYSNWEVNVGGVAGAVLPVGGTAGQVLAKINSTNFNTEWLSLGTMSSEPASAYLSTASAVANYLTISSASSTYQTQSAMSAYLSTSAAASTYQTQAGMSAYLSTSAAASTYQTQSGMSAYLSTSAASTTYIAQSSYATSSQAITGSSTTTVINPSTLLNARLYGGSKYMNTIVWTSATSNGSALAQNSNGRMVYAPDTLAGYGIYSAVIANNSIGTLFNSGFDFSKRVILAGRFCRNAASPNSNSIFRYSIGKGSATDSTDLSAKGIMIKQAGTGALQLLVHNGTSLTTTTSSFTPNNLEVYDAVAISDGSGNATLYVNGSQVATSTGAATSIGLTNNNYLMFEAVNTSTIPSGSKMVYCGSDMFVQVSQ